MQLSEDIRMIPAMFFCAVLRLVIMKSLLTVQHEDKKCLETHPTVCVHVGEHCCRSCYPPAEWNPLNRIPLVTKWRQTMASVTGTALQFTLSLLL